MQDINLSGILSQFLEFPSTTISILFIAIIIILIITLIVAIKHKKTEHILQKYYILDKSETPKSFLFWIISVLIVIRVIQVFLIQPFIVSGDSMLPNFHNNNILLIDKISYKLHAPERGEVIVFKFVKNNSSLKGKYFIKRIIGVPGDTVEVLGTVTTITTKNGEIIKPNEEFITFNKDNIYSKTILGEGEYFVMGDNRSGSYDSRSWGAVKIGDISGRAVVELYDNLSTLPEDRKNNYK